MCSPSGANGLMTLPAFWKPALRSRPSAGFRCTRKLSIERVQSVDRGADGRVEARGAKRDELGACPGGPGTNPITALLLVVARLVDAEVTRDGNINTQKARSR
jgi:hypothetical protein